MKVVDLVLQIIKQKPSDINKFINSFKSKGHSFERTFDLMNRTGFSQFSSYTPFYAAFGNKNFINTNKISNKSFLSLKINNGNSQGPVDLLLVNEKSKKCLAFTFKFFKYQNPKNFSKYEVSKMMTSPKDDILNSFKNYDLYFGIITNCKTTELQSIIYKSKSKDSEKVSVLLANPELNHHFNSFSSCLNKKISQHTKEQITKEDIVRFFEEITKN